MTKQIRTLNVDMTDCCCERCGAGSVETIEKERCGLDAQTLKPHYDYNKYTWYSADEEYNHPKHFENVAKTLNGTLVVNNGDSETSTKEEYEKSNF